MAVDTAPMEPRAPALRRGKARLRQLIARTLWQMKGGLALAGIGLAGVVATELVAPWPLKLIFDYVLLEKPLPDTLSLLGRLLEHGTLAALIVLAGSIALIALLNGAFSYCQVYSTTRIGYRLVYVLRRELFMHLQQLSLSFHTRAKSGELLTKVASDTNALKDTFSEWSITFFSHSVTLVGMLIIMVLLNWELSLVVAATLPLLLAVLFRLNRRVRMTVKQQRRQEGRIASRLAEVFSSMTLIQAFGRERYETDRFEAESVRTLEEGVRTARTTAAISKAIGAVTAVGTAGTVLFGAWLVTRGRMTPGDLLIFLGYVSGVYKPVRDMSRLSARFTRAGVSTERIAEILDIEPEIQEHPEAIDAEGLRGEIVFEDVCFRYPNGNVVLDHASFRIPAGERVALIGASGAGKSTIVNLMLRLYEPHSGSIRIDGIDIRRLRRRSLRSEISVVLQDTVLFGASIRENIAYGKPDASAEEIEQAARLAHAHEFIVALPGGYDAVLGERGATLSGGQRQRICLARALVRQRPILVLDEPTSAADPLSASLIAQAVTRCHADKTALVIAHQLSPLYQFDRILVLEHGRIVEAGAPAELLARRGRYHDFLQQQA